jgi:hypothetical protein
LCDAIEGRRPGRAREERRRRKEEDGEKKAMKA